MVPFRMLNSYPFQFTRSLLLFQSTRQYQKLSRLNTDLTHAVSEAEKIVGYPTSFLNLRWLLNDELANVALHFRKLIGTNHPLLQTARKLFLGDALPAWGLIVLLISKAGGLNGHFPDTEKDATAGVLHSQRALAEVVEMIRTSNLLHKSILNIDEKTRAEILDLNFGNKIALLSGDYLLSKSYHELACLKNQSLNKLMSSALRDLVDAEFIGLRDKQNFPIPHKPTNTETKMVIEDHFDTKPYSIKEVLGNPYAEWTLRNILGGASLLGKSCQGALKLAGHSDDVQQLGYLFGKNLALAWQARLEQELFLSRSSSERFSLICAPVMIHLHYEPELYEKLKKGLSDVGNVDYEDLSNAVQKGFALEKTRELQKELSINALDVLKKLPCCDARIALENIINTMV